MNGRRSLKDSTTALAITEDENGGLWIGENGKIVHILNGNLAKYAVDTNVSPSPVRALFQDTEGDLWLGMSDAGIYKTAGPAITAFSSDPGTRNIGAVEIGGKLYTYTCPTDTTKTCQLKALSGSDPMENRYRSIIPPIADSTGFVRMPNGRWQVVYGTNLYATSASRNYLTSTGEILDLANMTEGEGSHLIVLRSKHGKLIRAHKGIIFIGDDTYRSDGDMIDFLAESSSGQVWWFRRGTKNGRIYNGELQTFSSEMPDMDARSAFGDSRNWMWVGTRFNGVFVCKDLGSAKPTCDNFSKDDGLGSNIVWSITEDKLGRMYFGTERGLFRYDPSIEDWHSFQSLSDLYSGAITALSTDSEGNVWITTGRSGIFKIAPELDRSLKRPLPVYISEVLVAGKPLLLPAGAASEIKDIELESWQNDITIHFVGLQFSNNDNLRYQYQLMRFLTYGHCQVRTGRFHSPTFLPENIVLSSGRCRTGLLPTQPQLF